MARVGEADEVAREARHLVELLLVLEALAADEAHLLLALDQPVALGPAHERAARLELGAHEVRREEGEAQVEVVRLRRPGGALAQQELQVEGADGLLGAARLEHLLPERDRRLRRAGRQHSGQERLAVHAEHLDRGAGLRLARTQPLARALEQAAAPVLGLRARIGLGPVRSRSGGGGGGESEGEAERGEDAHADSGRGTEGTSAGALPPPRAPPGLAARSGARARRADDGAGAARAERRYHARHEAAALTPPAELCALVGPTAAGKTALALAVAEAAGAEVVSLDSMQVYRGLDVGTAKATAAERARACGTTCSTSSRRASATTCSASSPTSRRCWTTSPRAARARCSWAARRST
ncbi:MAG: hypothetical protein H6828_11125 [Planctomycetes bacterium]|nr:hypothetical protein [Planctomycetota bacterium]